MTDRYVLCAIYELGRFATQAEGAAALAETAPGAFDLVLVDAEPSAAPKVASAPVRAQPRLSRHTAEKRERREQRHIKKQKKR